MKTTVTPDEVHTPKTRRRLCHMGIVRSLRGFAWMLLALPLAAQAQFRYLTGDGKITITGYACTAGALNIPSTIDGLPVNRIAYKAFEECRGLTNVTIPDSVTSIEDWAFSQCAGLTSPPTSVILIRDLV